MLVNNGPLVQKRCKTYWKKHWLKKICDVTQTTSWANIIEATFIYNKPYDVSIEKNTISLDGREGVHFSELNFSLAAPLPSTW